MPYDPIYVVLIATLGRMVLMRNSIIVLALVGSLAAGSSGAPALAEQKPSILVSSPWIRAMPRGAPVAGGYATITNKGTTPDRLLGASIPTAPKGEVHSMTMQNGVMHMERLDKGLSVAPGATVTLTPGGYHLMFLKPKSQLKEGESVKGSLTFARAGTVPVTFAVAGMAAKAAPGAPADNGVDIMPGMDMKGK